MTVPSVFPSHNAAAEGSAGKPLTVPEVAEKALAGVEMGGELCKSRHEVNSSNYVVAIMCRQTLR